MSASGGRKFRVLATCATFEPGFKGGGPIRSLAYIVDSVPEHVEITLITGDRDLGDREAYPGLSGQQVRRGRSSIFYLNPRSIRQLIGLVRRARREPPDVLYVNSLFDPRFSIAPIFAARLGAIPARHILIAPRGELARSALSIKSTKKFFFLKFWLRMLGDRRRVLWHATSEAEASQINGVLPGARIEYCADYGMVSAIPSVVGESNRVPRFVFISRISEVKNLDLALRALAQQPLTIEFDIYGPIEDEEYWRRCTSLMSGIPANVTVRYRGELPHNRVQTTFSEYDCFLFPTKGESYGHVIPESLSASCPVICSDQTPWTAVLEAGGGKVVSDLNEPSLAAAIDEVASASARRRSEMRHATGLAFREWQRGFAAPNVIEQVALRLSGRAGE